MKKQIVILGSTGSIGTQALQVIEEQSDLFEVYAITANNSAELLVEQARKFHPEVVVIANPDKYSFVKESLQDLPIKVFAGSQSIAEVAEMEPVDIVLTAMVGYAGLLPTIHALKAGKTIALANKETMVVAGDLVCDLSKKHKSAILPVDSEHSAIFQCLAGELSPIEKIILTASGGPFRGKDRNFLEHVTPADALKHPNWSMGAKITIDSASMMNKGFEVIEAKWLFDVRPDQIVPVVHPQSLIHSMVQFEDGSVKAQMGLPDMKLPIQYAFTYPERVKTNYPRIDFFQCKDMTFEEPDMKVFRNLAFAFYALDKGGNMPCILNAANEVVVAAFLHEKIGFLQMSDVIEQTMQRVSFIKKPTYEDYVATDAEARKVASSLV
ncbi:MAG: 1-deoxy-D-xylulose-5-phosphate reductoisomerase [Paludibacteraceae bacterium]|nr:1-deoxy-D-xylulose-5-phosphate reductoisomerase [Paludibacteraceae bacterium]